MTFERRIGGEMEIYPEDLSAKGNVSAWPVFPGKERFKCNIGRSALQLSLADWQRNTSVKGCVWIPDYLCKSVSSSIEVMGIPIQRYIDIPSSIEFSAFPVPKDNDLVVIVHFFGKLNTNALKWLSTKAVRGWRVLEDCVQSPYTQGAGVVGEYVITSMRKWWPTPDGAAFYKAASTVMPEIEPPDEGFISQRFAAQLLRATDGGESTSLAWINNSEEKLEDSPPRACSWIAEQLLSRVDKAGAILRRRKNWQFLQDSLNEDLRCSAFIHPLYETLLPVEVPLSFPIRVASGYRDRLRAWLNERQIYCPIHWQLRDTASVPAKELSEEILSLPLDQRYTENNMERIVEALADFAKIKQHE